MDRFSQSSPTWSQALTLAERISMLTERGAFPLRTDAISQVAEQRLQHWRSEPQFETEAVFDQRLSIDGIDQDRLAQILVTPIELFSKPSKELDWVIWLAEGYSQPASSYANPPPGAEELYFLDLIQPLIDLACEQLFLGIDNILGKSQDGPFDPQYIEDILLMNLPGPLLIRLGRTMVLELNVARLQGHLGGETPADRFESYVQRIRQPARAIDILSEYPVLARQIVICLNQWVDVSLEFLERLCNDWQKILGIFCHGEDPGLLVELSAGAGDTHRGGRSVMIAQFESGFQLVYKPKSLAVDVHFQELLTWLNSKGCQPPLHTLEVFDCGSYGWVEYIPRQECNDAREVQRFYERLGSYLGLLYAINASDFHLENLIAMGEHPMLIDLETLFNPDFESFEQGDAASSAAQAMLSSVLVVGMLPQRLWSQEDYTGIDISGLGGESGQLSPDRVPQPDAPGTDEMRYVRQRLEMSGEANRPTLDGTEVSALDHIPEFIAGFRSMYQLLLQHRHELLANDGPLARFNADETRVLLRPTRTYDQLLFESFHPDVLSDALSRDLLIDRLWMVVPERSFMAKAIAAEQDDLRQGDIPVFTTLPASLTLWSAAGKPIDGILLEDGMSIARHRIDSLSHHDLQRQEWFIRSTLATLTTYEYGINSHDESTHHLLSYIGNISQQRLMAGARSVADKLMDTAVHGKDDVTWIGLEHLDDGIWDLLPIGTSLYSGLAGISLFLAFAGAILKDNAYTDLARKAVNGILRHNERFSSELPEIGAFEGWGGILYTLTQLAILWSDQALLSEAESLVNVIADHLDEDENFAVFDGAAGAICPLLAYYHATSSEIALDTAVACGDHLLTAAHAMNTGLGWIVTRHGPQPLLGFAHGTAGIAAALLQLAETSGQQRFQDTACQALAYERTLFSASTQNWPDLRHVALDEEPQRYPIAWCHGAVGIGLARLQAMAIVNDQPLAADFQAALQTALSRGFGQNHSLCHGDMGLIEFLLVAQNTTGDQKILDKFNLFGARILDSIDQIGWQCGGPKSVEIPGLMVGIAGIGYQLLRMAEPRQVPSILLLDKPPSIHTIANG